MDDRNVRATLPERLELGRLRSGPYGSDSSFGATGAFLVIGPHGRELQIIASDGSDPEGQGWEHVSVSLAKRPPNWEEMCFVKNLFWTPDECVVQYHPAQDDYINCHPNCLHLWRNVNFTFPTPPPILVGPKQEIT